MSKVFDLLLGIFREPGLIAEMRERALPDDVALVIRIAAGESAAIENARASTGESEEVLLEASVFFLQQILFAPSADSYRVLGVAADSAQEQLRDNYRWLMKWLHPDRNQDGWEAVYADRVNVAWQDMKTPQRRAEYDRHTSASSAMLPMVVSGARRIPPPASHGGPLLSGTFVRRLPALVLGALGVGAISMVGVTYWAQTQTERELAELRQDRARSAAAGVPVVAVATSADPLDESASTTNADPVPPPVLAPPAVPAAIEASAPIAAAEEPAPSTQMPPSADTPAAPIELASSAAPSGSAAAVPESSAPAVTPLSAVPELPAPAEVAAPLPAAPKLIVAAAPAPVNPEPESKSTNDPSRDAPSSSRRIPVRTVQATGPALAQEVATPAPRAKSPEIAPAEVGDNAGSPGTVPVAPAAAIAATVSAQAAQSAVDLQPALARDDAEALVREFAAAYAAGDLARFDRLFSASDRRAAGLNEMRSRFISTEMRYLEIQQLRWQSEEQSARARAAFRDTYVPRGERRAVTESGVIEWVIRVHAGDARIASVDRDATAP